MAVPCNTNRRLCFMGILAWIHAKCQLLKCNSILHLVILGWGSAFVLGCEGVLSKDHILKVRSLREESFVSGFWVRGFFESRTLSFNLFVVIPCKQKSKGNVHSTTAQSSVVIEEVGCGGIGWQSHCFPNATESCSTVYI